jgi:hypothetical protein
LGGFNSHLADSRKPEASTPTRRSDLDELLLPDLGRGDRDNVRFRRDFNGATPGLLGSDSNQSEETTQSESHSDLEEDLDRLLKLEGAGATTCRPPPIFYNYSDSNEEYSSTRTTPSSQRQGGLEDEGATACREAPILDNHSQPDDHPESFSGSHLGLT